MQIGSLLFQLEQTSYYANAWLGGALRDSCIFRNYAVVTIDFAKSFTPMQKFVQLKSPHF